MRRSITFSVKRRTQTDKRNMGYWALMIALSAPMTPEKIRGGNDLTIVSLGYWTTIILSLALYTRQKRFYG